MVVYQFFRIRGPVSRRNSVGDGLAKGEKKLRARDRDARDIHGPLFINNAFINTTMGASRRHIAVRKVDIRPRVTCGDLRRGFVTTGTSVVTLHSRVAICSHTRVAFVYEGHVPVVLLVIPVLLVARVPARTAARKRPPRAPLTHAGCAIAAVIDPCDQRVATTPRRGTATCGSTRTHNTDTATRE